jgi:hypothetical protein
MNYSVIQSSRANSISKIQILLKPDADHECITHDGNEK